MQDCPAESEPKPLQQRYATQVLVTVRAARSTTIALTVPKAATVESLYKQLTTALPAITFFN